MSDTHGYPLHMIDIPEGDILIHAGDLNIGQENKLRARLESFKKLPHKHKLLIPGNHDAYVYKEPDKCKDLALQEAGINILINDFIEVEGLKIWGSPYTPKFNNWAFMCPRDIIYKIWQQMPAGLDILVTHGPPDRILDLNDRGEHCGCASLRSYIHSRKPKHHVFGHIHEQGGRIEELDWAGTICYNVSVLDENYDIVRGARILEL